MGARDELLKWFAGQGLLVCGCWGGCRFRGSSGIGSFGRFKSLGFATDWALRFEVKGLAFKVKGLGFKVQADWASGFKAFFLSIWGVEGLGFKVESAKAPAADHRHGAAADFRSAVPREPTVMHPKPLHPKTAAGLGFRV